MKNRFSTLVCLSALAAFTLGISGCGDGEVCDCCTKKSDCEFGLKCVDLIGGSGKVCGSSGINYCYDDCGSSSSKLYDSRPAMSVPEEENDNDGTYAVMESLREAAVDAVAPEDAAQP